MDSATRETEQLIIKMEYRLQKEYSQAAKEIEEKLNKHFERYKEKDERQRKLVESGKLSEKDYKLWREQQLLVGKRWEKQKEVISNDLYNVNRIATSIVNGYMPEVYAIGHNFATYQIEKGIGIDTGYTLYNAQAVEKMLRENKALLPPPRDVDRLKDGLWNRQMLQSVMIQGILQGESIPKIAKRLASKTSESNRKSMIRNARTMSASALNGGRYDAIKRLKNMGVDVKLVWRATFDTRTRDSHRAMDGEVREVGEPFSNGLQFPVDMEKFSHGGKMKVADFNFICRETYNCRCVLHSLIKGLEPQAIKYRTGEVEGLSYEEWKKGRNKPRMIPKAKAKTGNIKETITNKDYEKTLRERLIKNYDSHVSRNGLRLLKSQEMGDMWNDKYFKDYFKVQWGNMDNKVVKDFTNQLTRLMYEYDTPLQEISLFDKMDMVGAGHSFAYVRHNYYMDSAKMRINPVICSSDKMLNRLKDLRQARYAIQFRDGAENIYVVTHEFAHTLLDLTQPLNNKKNWAEADYKKIKDVRKQILAVHKEYIEDVEKAKKVADAEELKVIMGDDTAAKKARELREKYNKTCISKYSLKDENEFMAEAFADAMLNDNPSPYSIRVKKILDDNYKRKK